MTGAGRDGLRRSAAHLFVDDLEFPELTDSDDHHARRVLRVRPSDTVSVSDGRGGWRLARLTSAGVEPVSATQVEPATTPWVGVAFSVPKSDRAEWAVQKLVELGVSAVAALECERSVVRWTPERSENRLERWRRIAREAAMQSRRTYLPEIVPPMSPVDVAGAALWLAEPGAPTLASHRSGTGEDRVWLGVGPEGGFTDTELSHSPVHFSLGSGILRTETAAVVAATLMLIA